MIGFIFSLLLPMTSMAVAGEPLVHCEQTYTVDKTNSKPLAQVIHENEFKPMPASRTFGFSPHTHWIKFECTNKAEESFSGEVQFTYPVVKTLNVYTDVKAAPVKLGYWDRAAIPSEEIKVLPGFPFQIEGKSNLAFFVEARSNGSLQLQTNLLGANETASANARPIFFYGFFFGALIILAIYNLFLGLSLRDGTYILYCGYVVSFFLYQVTITGFSAIIFGKFGYHLTEFRALFLHSLFFFIALFANRFLKLKSNSPGFSYAMRILAAFYFFGFFASLAIDTQSNLKFLAGASTLVPLILIITAVKAHLSGFKPAKYFIAAWTVFLVAIVVTALRNVGLVPKIWLVDHVLEFGILAEVTLISMGLGYNVRLLQDEKNFIASNALREKLKISELNAHLEKEKTLSQISSQVSHDIRSPLSALNMVLATSNDLDEERRLLVRNAVLRINDIANSLLSLSRRSASSSEELTRIENANADKTSTLMIVALLDSIISEKRMQYRENLGIEIFADLDQGYGLFTSIDATEFSRVISNLVNNSVEAIASKGRVTVAVRSSEKHISVLVADDGKGIPAELLPLLGERGVSSGKDPQGNSGMGLGLYHAKATVEKFGGKIQIQSKEGAGTIVTITLPRSSPPNWFIDKIALNDFDTVVTVDDDATIHQIWSERLSSFLKSNEGSTHLSFASTSEFKKWHVDNKSERALYLIDYEYLNQNESGLDLIESAGIQAQAVLVTSHFEDTQVLERASAAGVAIIPKALAAVVPIVI